MDKLASRTCEDAASKFITLVTSVPLPSYIDRLAEPHYSAFRYTAMKHTEEPAVEPEPSWEEFRRYSRRDIDVRIKIALNNNGVQTYVYGRGNDIAEGGMAAYISMEMSIGSRIKLEVQLPYSQQPLKILATVRNRHGFRYGLEFTTVSGAELLKMQDQIGTVEAGKFADIVALPGDPLADVANLQKIDFVMKGGKVYRRP